MKYRAQRWHNYLLPSIYHITLTQLPGRLPFSAVEGVPTAPRVTLTPFGAEVQAILRQTLNRLPYFFLGSHIIMPDHIHMIVTVLQELPRSIRSEVAAVKSQISKAHARLCGYDNTVSVFVNDFHHRIIFNDNELEVCKAYIDDNPRRLLIKRSRPDLFRRYNHLRIRGSQSPAGVNVNVNTANTSGVNVNVNTANTAGVSVNVNTANTAGVNISGGNVNGGCCYNIGEMEMAAYGNVFLLRDYQKMPVRIHRRWTDDELESYRRRCFAVAANGGVLVSPFIHKWERAIRNEALEMGARIIHLRIDGFEDRFKPSGHDFDLCTEGRLLVLAPWPDNHNATLYRNAALYLNDLATRIAGLSTGVHLSLGR